MPKRLSYEDSYRSLQDQKLFEAGPAPRLPIYRPRHDDEHPGVSFFRMMVADADFHNLTLPRTFFGRSEIRNSSFKGADVSESTANWNDFIDVSFEDADLSNSDLRACLFERVRFNGANLTGVDFRYCGLKQCDFTDANLTDAKLTTKCGAVLNLSPEQKSVIDWQAEEGEEPEGG